MPVQSAALQAPAPPAAHGKTAAHKARGLRRGSRGCRNGPVHGGAVPPLPHRARSRWLAAPASATTGRCASAVARARTPGWRRHPPTGPAPAPARHWREHHRMHHRAHRPPAPSAARPTQTSRQRLGPPGKGGLQRAGRARWRCGRRGGLRLQPRRWHTQRGGEGALTLLGKHTALAHQPGLQRGHIGIGGHATARRRPPGLRHHHARWRRRGKLLHQRLQQPPHSGRHALRRPCSTLHRFSAASSRGRQGGCSRRGQRRGPGRGRCCVALRNPTLALRLQRLAGAGRQAHPVGQRRVTGPLGQRRRGQRRDRDWRGGRRSPRGGRRHTSAPFFCAQQHVLPL